MIDLFYYICSQFMPQMVSSPIYLDQLRAGDMMPSCLGRVVSQISWRGFNGEPYVIYGDPAYGVTRNILVPFRGAHLTDDQQAFNSQMSKVRSSVEWGFGKIIQYFSYLDFNKNLKVLLQPVAKFYLVGALVTNCHTCLYGSLTSTYFNVDPPSLDVYLSNQ